MKLEFFGNIFEKKSQISDFMKIRPVGTEMLHVDGQKWWSSESLSAILRTPPITTAMQLQQQNVSEWSEEDSRDKHVTADRRIM